jgi:hypothetical protein
LVEFNESLMQGMKALIQVAGTKRREGFQEGSQNSCCYLILEDTAPG